MTLVWLLAALLIALGAAGIVAGMDTPPADGSDRTGRTGYGDAQLDASLDAIETQVRELSVAVEMLGQHSRVILASLSGNSTEAIDTATAHGTALVGDIKARVEDIRDALVAVPVIGSHAEGYELSPATRERHAAYLGALDAADGIEGAWTQLTVSALSANRLSRLLAAHDQAVVDAAADGRRGRYAGALERLDDADAAIADAKTMRDRLAATVDVTTLDQWLKRSGDYDAALRGLYRAVRNGEGPDAIRELMQAEQRAKDRLPPDTRSLVLIMSDIGQGGINAAAIQIEQAHTDLEESLARASDQPAP